MSQDDAFGFHEVVHMSSFLVCAWDEEITRHGALESAPELLSEAKKITELMGDFYQKISLYSVNNFFKD